MRGSLEGKPRFEGGRRKRTNTKRQARSVLVYPGRSCQEPFDILRIRYRGVEHEFRVVNVRQCEVSHEDGAVRFKDIVSKGEVPPVDFNGARYEPAVHAR